MSRNAADLVRDAIATIEARETYERRMAHLKQAGAYLTSRRVQRASLAELVNPDTPEYGGSRARH